MYLYYHKFSGSYNSAVNARNMLLEDYPDAKIEVIDSTLNTVEEGIFVREAARMKAAGLRWKKVCRHWNGLNQPAELSLR